MSSESAPLVLAKCGSLGHLRRRERDVQVGEGARNLQDVVSEEDEAVRESGANDWIGRGASGGANA